MLAVASLFAVLSTSCGKDEWTVKGDIEGGDGKTIFLEASTNGRWYVLDSVKLEDGDFEFNSEPSGFPDIYRLNLDGKFIYFPIDSIETVSVDASLAGTEVNYSLSGSPSAEMLSDVDHKVALVAKKHGEAAVATDSLLKRELAGMLLGNPASPVAYYIINKKVGFTPVFNPEVRSDLRIIGAVANAYHQYRPNDPRAESLRKLYVSHRNYNKQATDTIRVAEIPILDFELFDENGAKQSLSGFTSKGGVVVLNFTTYDAAASPEFNMQLNKIYSANKGSGLEIVQVAVDKSQFDWEKAAKNIPWVTLYAPENVRADILLKYNVGQLPATYVINRDGDLVERVDDVAKLSGVVERYL